MTDQNTIITPTVGRKVWYRPNEYDRAGANGMVTPTGAPLDATVVAVWNDRLINLVVFDANGQMFRRTSVKLRQEGDPVLDGQAYAEWMPYQVGQAAKHAAPLAGAAS